MSDLNKKVDTIQDRLGSLLSLSTQLKDVFLNSRSSTMIDETNTEKVAGGQRRGTAMGELDIIRSVSAKSSTSGRSSEEDTSSNPLSGLQFMDLDSDKPEATSPIKKALIQLPDQMDALAEESNEDSSNDSESQDSTSKGEAQNK